MHHTMMGGVPRATTRSLSHRRPQEVDLPGASEGDCDRPAASGDWSWTVFSRRPSVVSSDSAHLRAASPYAVRDRRAGLVPADTAPGGTGLHRIPSHPHARGEVRGRSVEITDARRGDDEMMWGCDQLGVERAPRARFRHFRARPNRISRRGNGGTYV
jgi:hypothetical protein